MKKLYLCALLVSILVTLGGCGNDGTEASVETLEATEVSEPLNLDELDYFPNGVAAGDVDQTSAVLWARAQSTGLITLEYGRDPNFSGSPDGFRNVDVKNSDIPVKEVITGLLPSTQYYYRFCRGEFCPKSGLHALIDIKPDSDPNSVNPRSKGVIPVAVLGSIDLDAMQIDYSTVTFGPGEATPAHNGHAEDVNDDGITDAVFHFRTQESGIVCGDTSATLNGELFDQSPISGTDSVNTVGCNGVNAEQENGTSAEIVEKRGEFRTPFADGRHGLRFGVSSCWRGDEKPFYAIKNIPERDLDFFVALGDTTYADSEKTPNKPDGNGARAKTLDDFRFKHNIVYSENKNPKKNDPANDTSPGDNLFVQARMSTAFYATIDDHEIVNNFQGGAIARTQNLSAECIDWGLCFCPSRGDPDCSKQINETKLFKNGLRAWREYNPVRREKYGETNSDRTRFKDKLYRYRKFGKDAAIFLLDTRSFRDEPASFDILLDILPKNVYDRRTILGARQRTHLQDDLEDAQENGILWKFVLVPEPIQNIGRGGAPDRFEGYAYERALILDHIRQKCITNVVFISGDIHGTLANNLAYKENFVDRKIYSSTWDISTGAVSYPEPMAPAILATEIKGFKPFEDDEIKYWNRGTSDLKNEFFENFVNDGLSRNNSPHIGLEDDVSYLRFLDQKNRSTPAKLVDLDLDTSGMQGRYSSTNTNGWTEFEIKSETPRNLVVTTWGIERDRDQNLVKNDVGEFSPEIVSKFVVKPRSKSEISCGVGKPNGSVCALDSGCSSGRCAKLVCMAKLGVGSSCIFNSDCLSDDCGGLPRVCR